MNVKPRHITSTTSRSRINSFLHHRIVIISKIITMNISPAAASSLLTATTESPVSTCRTSRHRASTINASPPSSADGTVPPVPSLPPPPTNHDNVADTVSSPVAENSITNSSTQDAPDSAVDSIGQPLFSVSDRPPLVVDGYVIEGLDNASEQIRRHAQAFYNALIPFAHDRSHTFQLFNKDKYVRIFTALNRLRNGESLKALRSEYLQIHKWNKMYSLVVVDIGKTSKAEYWLHVRNIIQGSERLTLRRASGLFIWRMFLQKYSPHMDLTMSRGVLYMLVCVSVLITFLVLFAKCLLTLVLGALSVCNEQSPSQDCAQ